MKVKVERYVFSGNLQKYFVVGMLLGVAAFCVGLIFSPQQAWLSYMVNVFYFVSLALGGGVLVAIAAITKASWITPYKRITEQLSSFLPIGLLLAFGLFFGIHSLYEWSHHEIVQNDPILLGKSAYLNTSGFIVRTLIFIALWTIFTWKFRQYSLKQDVSGDEKFTHKMGRLAPLFLIVYGLTYTFFSYDWLMSIRPHWFSTIFAIYTFSGMIVNTLAVVVFIIILLSEQGLLKGVVTEEHLHDLGKLIFGFSTFWAYIWISQYLLIWYSNIPEETGYYLQRNQHSWDWLFYFNLILNWGVPFFALMTRGAKRSTFILKRVAIVLFIGHWLDIYLMSAPEVFHHAGLEHFSVAFIEVGMAIGFMSLFCYVYLKRLEKNSLIAINDPLLQEGIHLHQM